MNILLKNLQRFSIKDQLKKFYVRRNIAQKPKASNIRGKILELIRVFDTPNQTINTEDEAIREAEALQNQHVHRIGNLTLTAYNFYNPLVNEKITSPKTPLNINTLIVPILPE